MGKRRKKEDFESGFRIEKNRIEKPLLKKSPLSTPKLYKGIFKTEIPKSTINTLESNKKSRPNKEYLKKVIKYFQTYLYDSSNEERLTLCKEGRVFRLHRDDFLEHKKQKIKIPAKQVMDCHGGWEDQVHSYYFAIPRTYKVKKEIFEGIIKKEILEKFGEEYIKHKKEIEDLLKDAEKFMSWIEITPTIKKGYKKLCKSNNFSQYIIDFICEGKDISRALHLITDFCLAPILMKIEDLFFFGTDDSPKTEINVYRILRRKLSKKGLAELPEDYEKHIEGKIFEKVLEESMKNKNFDKFLETFNPLYKNIGKKK